MDANQLKTPRSGLTLVELLVVLVILAVMTIIAVQSTEFLVDQARYNSTQQTLQNVQTAIVGPNNQSGANGSPTVAGFVADMGRLPINAPASLSGDPLAELWDQTAVLSVLASIPAPAAGATYNATPVAIPSVTSTQTGAATLKISATLNYTATIPCGWRGPYLQLSLGTIRPLDGWGNPLQSIYQAPGLATYPPLTPPAFGFPVNAVCSLGSDFAFNVTIPASPYAQDQYVPAQTNVPPIVPLANFSQMIYGAVSVTVQSINTTVTPSALTNPFPSTPPEATPTVRIVLFAPVNGTMTSFILDSTAGPTAYNPNPTPATYLPAGPYYPLYVPNPTPVDFAIAATTTSYAGSFFNVPIGPRAIQAFQYDAATMIITKRSPLTYLTVTPNSTLTPTLILQ